MMEDARNPQVFSPEQLQYIAGHIAAIESRMLRELVLSNLVVIVVFTFFSYLLSQGLFDSLADSVEREKRFIDDASHELRTPLAAITTIAETTLRSRTTTPDEYKLAFTEVFEESKRLSTTINDLLFISKSDGQRLKLHMELQDLTKLVTTVSKRVQVVADQKAIKIETTVPANQVLVMADGDKIKQLLTILLDNAIKYSHAKSKIVLRLETKPKPQVFVTDFGQGISSQDLPHIFERFYRSDSSRTDSGSGLGLSIAEWIAEAHNIKLGVRSRLGKGSTFSLTFTM